MVGSGDRMHASWMTETTRLWFACMCTCESDREESELGKWFRQAGDGSLLSAAPPQVSSFMQRRGKQSANATTNPTTGSLVRPHAIKE